MIAFPTELPVDACRTLISSVRSEQPIPKNELVLAAWNVQGFVLGQLCGTPTLTIGTQTTADPVAALEAAVRAVELGCPISEANVPWASVTYWISDLLKLFTKDRD